MTTTGVKILTKEKDPIKAGIAAAMKLLRKTANEAHGDLRTSCSEMTASMEAAIQSLSEAQGWYEELLKEEAANEREEAKAPAPPKPVVHECAGCAERIEPGDVTVCSGCDREICPECMGDGVCKECEEEGD